MDIIKEIMEVIKEEAAGTGVISLRNSTKTNFLLLQPTKHEMINNQKPILSLPKEKEMHAEIREQVFIAKKTPLTIKDKQEKNTKKEFNLEFPKVINDSLERIKKEISECKNCDLCSSRTNTVPGEGNSKAELMLIGEGPGKDEDEQGRPFVGRSGQLLTKMLNAMGYQREDVFIANIVKCRPPNNRNPHPEEAHSCIGYLLRQINLINPKVIILLGAVPTKYLLNQVGISKIHGDLFKFNGITTIPTFHPAYLLRDPRQKKYAWEDLQKAMKILEKKIC